MFSVVHFHIFITMWVANMAHISNAHSSRTLFVSDTGLLPEFTKWKVLSHWRYGNSHYVRNTMDPGSQCPLIFNSNLECTVLSQFIPVEPVYRMSGNLKGKLSGIYSQVNVVMIGVVVLELCAKWLCKSIRSINEWKLFQVVGIANVTVKHIEAISMWSNIHK